MIDRDSVIVFPVHETSWGTMLAIAKHIKRAGVMDPIVLFTERVEHFLPQCEEAGLRSHLFGQRLNAHTHADNGDPDRGAKRASAAGGRQGVSRFSLGYVYRGVRRVFQTCEDLTGRRILSLTIYHLVRAAWEVAGYIWVRRGFEAFLDATNPKAIYIYMDNIVGYFALFVALCKKRGIRIIVPPAAFSHPSIIGERRSWSDCTKVDIVHSPWIIFLLRKAFPGQFYRLDCNEVSFYFAYEILAMWFYGILPRNPWVRGGSSADVICVEDRYVADWLVTQGVDRMAVHPVGHIDCDNLFWAIKNDSKESIFEKYGFDKTKKLLVVSLPHLMEEGYVPTWEQHWFENGRIIEAATGTGQNVLLVLHPKMQRSRYQFLEDKYPCRICTTRTSDVLPFADVYVACASSTIFWSVACGVVTINVGWLGKIDMFDHLSCVIPVHDEPTYRQLLERLVYDEDFFCASKAAVLRIRDAYFPVLDGNNLANIVRLASL